MHFGLQVLRPLSWDSPPPSGACAEDSGQMMGFLILWFLGMGRRVFFGFASQFGAISGVLNWACLAALSAYALRVGPKKRGITFWVILFAGTLVELLMNIRTGSKAYIMFSFMPVLWLFARERPLRKWIPVLGAGFVAFYLGIVQPVVMTTRLTSSLSEEGFGEKTMRVFLKGDYRDARTERSEESRFLERQFDPIPVGFLHHEVERAGFRYWETMDYLAYAFIPRILWSDKPDVTRGAWFTVYLGQAQAEEDATTSTGLTAIGELYWNFGWTGVILGIAILGLFLGYLWRLCGESPERHPIRFLLYVSLLFGIIDMPEAGTVFVACVYQLVVLGSAIWMADGIRRRRTGLA